MFSADNTTHDIVLPVFVLWTSTEFPPVDVHCTAKTCTSFSSTCETETAGLLWRSIATKLKVSNRPHFTLSLTTVQDVSTSTHDHLGDYYGSTSDAAKACIVCCVEKTE
jgi:hypothetical protein